MKNILIIEPFEFDREYLSRIIFRLGYGCQNSDSAESAYEIMAGNLPDLVICGDGFPGDKEFHVCQLIKGNPVYTRIPLIMVHSDTGQATRTRAIEAGCVDIISKPIKIRPLFRCLEQILSGSRRKHIRAAMTFPVSVTLEGETFGLESTNFGEGGMYLKSDSPWDRGTQLDLQFSLPRLERNIKLPGEVVYSTSTPTQESPPGMGVMFKNLNDSYQSFLSVYMENHLTSRAPVDGAAHAAVV